MRPVAVVAAAAVSALGRGRAAYAVGRPGDEPRSAIEHDSEFEAAGLRHPWVGKVRLSAWGDDLVAASDPAEALILTCARDLGDELDDALPGWRSQRIGLVIGTSSGAMASIERAFAARDEGALTPDLARQATYYHPVGRLSEMLGIRAQPVNLLAACASSTIAIGIGARWIEAERFELVVAGGYDALSKLVAVGFDALGALTRGTPLPFRAERDGMAVGEGAGLIAMRSRAGPSTPVGHVYGFGASSDAVHITAPDRNGAGLARAASSALADAGLEPDAIDLVSAHGTATPFNDAAESLALRSVFGDRSLPVYPFKAVVGHTLGAAGVLETLSTWDALAQAVLPAVPGSGTPCDAAICLPERNRSAVLRRAMKLSAAFGGANAALVIGGAIALPGGEPRPRRGAHVSREGTFVETVDFDLVAQFSRVPAANLSRVDSLSELVLTAVARLIEALGGPIEPGAALIVATASATLEADELFDARRRRGVAVEPRRFPPTSPNVCAGWACIAFGFQGPSLTVGGAAEGVYRDALELAYDLVGAGDVDSAVVVRAEDVGQAARDLFVTAGLPVPRRGAQALLVSPGGDPAARVGVAGGSTESALAG